MATTKKKSTSKTTTTKRNESLPARTARTVRDRPYTSAAIAAGAAAVAGAIAGMFMLKRSGKTVGEVADDVSSKVKKEAKAARETFKDGVEDVKAKAKEMTQRRKDGIDPDKSQEEISQEALSLKQTGEIIDEQNQAEVKAGSVAY